MLNTATSIVDYLSSQKKPSDFNSRKTLYDTSGLSGAFGDYRGTAEQNTTLLKKLSATPSPTTDTTSTDFLLGKTDPATGLNAVPEAPIEDKTPKDVVDQTGPSTISSIYDLAKSDEEKAAEASQVEESMALAGQTARASEGLQRDVNTLNRTASEGIFDLAQAGSKKKAQIGEEAAGFGGANSGMTKASQAEVTQDVIEKQGRIQAKLGDSLYNQFSDFEKNYGTEFLSKLSIPEAESFSKLPVAVRGIVMQNYQDTIAKSQAAASKNALSTLEKLGYTVVGGQIIQTLAGQSAELNKQREARLATPAEPAAPAAQKEYEYAQTQGFKGSFLDYQKLKATQYGTETPGGGGNKLTLSESRTLGLPLSLVGTSEETLAKQVASSTPPTWFFEENPGPLSPERIKTLWKEFQSKLKKTGREA